MTRRSFFTFLSGSNQAPKVDALTDSLEASITNLPNLLEPSPHVAILLTDNQFNTKKFLHSIEIFTRTRWSKWLRKSVQKLCPTFLSIPWHKNTIMQLAKLRIFSLCNAIQNCMGTTSLTFLSSLLNKSRDTQVNTWEDRSKSFLLPECGYLIKADFKSWTKCKRYTVEFI